MERTYACIDLKSFYASCECVERGLDPLKTNLVVADSSRTEKTICLAVTPSLKKYGLSGRARLFDFIEKVKEVNMIRKLKINDKNFLGKTYDSELLDNNIYLALDYIIASPRMSLYIKYSTIIYNVYLKYLSSDDIYVYSIDEVFCDLTNYLKYYKKNVYDLVSCIINDIYKTTGITATGGIGTNLYLAKVAMDIVAKHKEPDFNGSRIAYLNEILYRKLLWEHEPLTDFWRVGRGISERLKKNGIYTMGDLARFSIDKEDQLYKEFGVNAELIIDHAWGYEPCTISDVKNYKPLSTSLSKGQVLMEPYGYQKAKLVTLEMMEILSLEMVEKGVVTDCIVLDITYDISNLNDKKIKDLYKGEIVHDFYGREIPKNSHGTTKINHKTADFSLLGNYIENLFDKIVNPILYIRKINICACNLSNINEKITLHEQLDLFNCDEKFEMRLKAENDEIKIQKVLLDIKKRSGKNSILKGFNFLDGATTIARNKQIGGHKSE